MPEAQAWAPAGLMELGRELMKMHRSSADRGSLWSDLRKPPGANGIPALRQSGR